MRAAVLVSVGEPLEIAELELGAPQQGEVRVRLAASGVCHSDLSLVEGRVPYLTPVVLGHEGAGVVEAVGSGVTRVSPGDHVVIAWVPNCGHCFHCLRGERHLCLTAVRRQGRMDDGGTRFQRDGVPVFHGLDAATFAEATVVRESAVVRIDPGIPLATAALVGCAVTTGVGAALHTAGIRPGERVVVIGCGGVGLSAVMGCRLAGAERIVAVDPVAERRQAALRLGASEAFEPEEAADAVMELTSGIGADAVFEVVGRPELQRQAWEMTRRGGRTVLVGVAAIGVETSLPSLALAISERQIRGCYYGSAFPERDFPAILSLYRAGRLDLDALISQRLPLDGVNDALDAMRRGEHLRTVLTLGDEGRTA